MTSLRYFIPCKEIFERPWFHFCLQTSYIIFLLALYTRTNLGSLPFVFRVPQGSCHLPWFCRESERMTTISVSSTIAQMLIRQWWITDWRTQACQTAVSCVIDVQSNRTLIMSAYIIHQSCSATGLFVNVDC